MPEIRRFTVEQRRSVEVAANSPEDALRLAASAFQDGQNIDCGLKKPLEGIWGNTVSQVRTIEYNVNEKGK